MKKKGLCLIGIVILVVTMMGQVLGAEIEWQWFGYQPATDRVNLLYKEFAKEILSSSNGRFKITVYGPGELPYTAADGVKITSTNKVQMADAAVGFVSRDVPELDVFSLPFFVTSFDDYFKAVEKVGYIYNDVLRKRFNVDLYLHWTNPSQNFWTKKPIKTLEDFKGMKIRIWNPNQVTILKNFGGTPVSITSAEVVPALQRGVIDGAITSALSVSDWKMYEVVSNGLLVDYMIGSQFIIYNIDEFNKLPKDLQQLFLEKGKEFYLRLKKATPEFEMQARENLLKHGMQFHKLPPGDFQKARNMMKPMWDEWLSKNGPVARKLFDGVSEALHK